MLLPLQLPCCLAGLEPLGKAGGEAQPLSPLPPPPSMQTGGIAVSQRCYHPVFPTGGAERCCSPSHHTSHELGRPSAGWRSSEPRSL